jgi:hypothetical protein
MIKAHPDGLKYLLCLIMHYTHGSRRKTESRSPKSNELAYGIY